MAVFCSAELYFAVSQSCTLRSAGIFHARRTCERPADYKSAIQPRVSGCRGEQVSFDTMFMSMKWHFWVVSDLGLAQCRSGVWQLFCCHVQRPIRPLPIA